ncbi:hypothetical protein ACKFKF_23790 [Phormidesmis sp. 146-12]
MRDDLSVFRPFILWKTCGILWKTTFCCGKRGELAGSFSQMGVVNWAEPYG